jgi:exodeoxyribonuclease V alpha subunit
MQLLQELKSRKVLTELDVQFATAMARFANDTSDPFLLAACLASNWLNHGHVCVDLVALAGRDIPEWGVRAPALDPWIAALRANRVVGEPGSFCPLILDASQRLYLHRYWHYEQQLARDLCERAHSATEVDAAALRQPLDQLFPGKETDTNWQKVAAATAVLRPFCVISGGPGTGKTTTVVKLLALLQQMAGEQPLSIALAAPTGKAAMRMEQAIRRSKETLGLPEALAANIPEKAATLHRLLRMRPKTLATLYHRGNPLPVDVLIVDEASMIDLPQMYRLTQALPPHARLILLGDKDQLESVQAGTVLGDICASAGFSGAFQALLETATGESLPATAARASALGDSIVVLRKSHRFGADSGIGKLARAVNEGEAVPALELLQQGLEDVHYRPVAQVGELRQGLAEWLMKSYAPYLEQVRAGAAPAACFAAFDRFRILCAHRTGPFGLAMLNEQVEALLAERRLLRRGDAWYPGRPVMITSNDYQLQLFNGDIGLALPGPNGHLAVAFQDADGGIRMVAPGRLPAHETAYAMTIHKSQGSEFDQVLMLLPNEPSPIMTRQLIYTGITRARKRIVIWGQAAVFLDAVGHVAQRSSGLKERLATIAAGG